MQNKFFCKPPTNQLPKKNLILYQEDGDVSFESNKQISKDKNALGLLLGFEETFGAKCTKSFRNSFNKYPKTRESRQTVDSIGINSTVNYMCPKLHGARSPPPSQSNNPNIFNKNKS
jgi:hypothetical protein